MNTPKYDSLMTSSTSPMKAEDRRKLTEQVAETTARICTDHVGGDLQALILTGSLARDEGSIVGRNGRRCVLGDAEFMVILRHQLSRFYKALPAIRQAIARELDRHDIDIELSLSAAKSDYLRNLKPRIFAHELRRHGHVVCGDPRVLENIPAFQPADIPLEDGWRLLSNRMIEEFESVIANERDKHALCYSTIKLRIDLATSLSLFAGCYQSTYAGRAVAVRKLAAEQGASAHLLIGRLDAIAASVDACTAWKLNPSDCLCHGSPREFAADALADARALWMWELQQLYTAGNVADPAELIFYAMSSQTAAERLRGWISVWRTYGWLGGFNYWTRWLGLARRGSPRYCVYSVIGDIAETIEASLRGDNSSELDKGRLLDMLPIASHSTTPTGVVVQLAYNYHTFLEGTVS